MNQLEEITDHVFWISGNTPSSKNNRVWTGTHFHSSPATQKWRRQTKFEWMYQKMIFQYLISTLPIPYFIELTFIRKSRHRFDYGNIAQAVLDEMVFHEWLVDDNANWIKPYYGTYVHDPVTPGVIIKILKEEPIHDLQNITRPDHRVLQQRLSESISNSGLTSRRRTKLP